MQRVQRGSGRLGVIGGIVGGIGAFVYQLAMQPPNGTPEAYMAFFFLIVAVLILGGAGVLALAGLRRPRRLRFALIFVGAFLGVFYALGGEWPFWKP